MLNRNILLNKFSWDWKGQVDLIYRISESSTHENENYYLDLWEVRYGLNLYHRIISNIIKKSDNSRFLFLIDNPEFKLNFLNNKSIFNNKIDSLESGKILYLGRKNTGNYDLFLSDANSEMKEIILDINIEELSILKYIDDFLCIAKIRETFVKNWKHMDIFYKEFHFEEYNIKVFDRYKYVPKQNTPWDEQINLIYSISKSSCHEERMYFLSLEETQDMLNLYHDIIKKASYISNPENIFITIDNDNSKLFDKPGMNDPNKIHSNEYDGLIILKFNDVDIGKISVETLSMLIYTDDYLRLNKLRQSFNNNWNTIIFFGSDISYKEKYLQEYEVGNYIINRYEYSDNYIYEEPEDVKKIKKQKEKEEEKEKEEDNEKEKEEDKGKEKEEEEEEEKEKEKEEEEGGRGGRRDGYGYHTC